MRGCWNRPVLGRGALPGWERGGEDRVSEKKAYQWLFPPREKADFLTGSLTFPAPLAGFQNVPVGTQGSS